MPLDRNDLKFKDVTPEEMKDLIDSGLPFGAGTLSKVAPVVEEAAGAAFPTLQKMFSSRSGGTVSEFPANNMAQAIERQNIVSPPDQWGRTLQQIIPQPKNIGKVTVR